MEQWMKQPWLHPGMRVSDIVNSDHRAAAIFVRHNINFCCGGNWPLEIACEAKGLHTDDVITELARATSNARMPADEEIASWSIDFLSAYITNIYYSYIQHELPLIRQQAKHFYEKHRQKHPELASLESILKKIEWEWRTHVTQNVETIFPYLRQLERTVAGGNKDGYAIMLVKTMNLPVKKNADKQCEKLNKVMQSVRELIYDQDPNATTCTRHKLLMNGLMHFDREISTCCWMETHYLIPKAVQMQQQITRH